MQKEVWRIDKKGNEITNYNLLIVPDLCMASSLSDFVNNLAKGIHKTKCK